MKTRLLVIALIQMITNVAFATFIKVGSIYQNETERDEIKEARFSGVGTYLKDERTSRHFVVTVGHLVAGRPESLFIKTYDERSRDLERIGAIYSDHRNDLALFEISTPPKDFTSALIFSSGRLRLADQNFRIPSHFYLVSADQSSVLIAPRAVHVSSVLDSTAHLTLAQLRTPEKKEFLGDERYNNYIIRHLQVKPGMSGSLLISKDESGELIPYGLAAQYDRVMSRSYFTPVSSIETLLEKALAVSGNEGENVEWRVRDCQLHRYFKVDNLLESIFPSAGGADFGDGGGSDFADGGNSVCPGALLSEQQEVELALNSFSGMQDTVHRQRVVVSYRVWYGNTDWETAEFQAGPHFLRSWFRTDLRVTPVEASEIDFRYLLKQKLAREEFDVKPLSSVFEMLKTASSTKVFCSGQVHEINGNHIGEVIIEENRIKIHLETRDCEGVSDEISFSISFLELEQLRDKRMLLSKDWLFKEVTSKQGKVLLVDLRNFWFSHPNDPLKHIVIQVRPAPRELPPEEKSGSRWWAYYSLFSKQYFDSDH